MTQKWYKISALLSFLLFSLTLFHPFTISLLAITLYFTFSYIRTLIKRYIQKGLIEFLPQKLQNQLMNRSFFDIMCDIWFIESINLLKVLLKPFFIHIEPDHAGEVLNELNGEIKSKILAKGVFNMMPQILQRPILGEERIKFAQQQFQFPQQKMQQMMKLESCNDTIDNSNQAELKTMKRMRKSSSVVILNNKFIDSPDELSNYEKASEPRKSKYQKDAKWDKLEEYKKQEHQKKLSPSKKFKGVAEMFKDFKLMATSFTEIKKVTKQISRAEMHSVLKIAAFFWILLLLQIKLNSKTRRIIFKTLFIIAGMLSVMGALGTTGMLIYKQYTKMQQRKMERLQNQQE